MKYVIAFGLLGAVCLFQALRAESVAATAGWLFLALSPLLLASAYLLRAPWLLLKDAAAGRLWPIAYGMLLPYHALNWLLLPLVRRLGAVQGPVEISPAIWLGPRPLPSDSDHLPEFSGVIDLCAEFSEVPFLLKTSGYRCFPVLDGMPPREIQIRAAVDHAADCLDRGPVYIHCASGHSRSAVVAAALLVRLQRAGTLEEALAQIRKRRPRANPTPQQRRVAELAI